MLSPLHAAGLLLLTGPAISADGSTLDATGSVIQMLLGLGLVIGLLYATLHILRRIGGGNTQAGAMLKILGAAAVGPRERVVLVEVADRILVLGVAPGRVNTLHTLDAGDIPRDPDGGRSLSGGKDFQTWLKQTLERRSR